MVDTETLIANLSEKPVPVVPLPHPFYALAKWIVGAGIYILALSLCFGIRVDLGERLMTPLFLTEIVLLGVMVIASGLSVAVLSFPDLYGKRWAAYAPFVPLVVLATVLGVEWLENIPPAPKPAHGIECLLCILCYAIIPACWIFYRLRKTATTHGGLAGGVALLGAFGIGALAFRLSEPTDSIIHLIEWHYLPMLAFSVLGIWLGKKYLKW